MNKCVRSGLLRVLLHLLIFPVGCSRSENDLPVKICGTRVSADSARPLMTATGDWHEFNRVDFNEATSAPCVLMSGRDPVLYFNFYWTKDAPNLAHLTTGDESVLGITQLREVDRDGKEAVGNNGGIFTAPCRFKGRGHFTLTLKLPRSNPTDQSHRKDIEKFMRSYFPATVKTLGCQHDVPR